MSLNGVRSGDATWVAIIALPGRTSRNGNDTREKMSLENGSRQTKTSKTAPDIFSRRSRSSTRITSYNVCYTKLLRSGVGDDRDYIDDDELEPTGTDKEKVARNNFV